jgi:hypothetical protein
VGMHIATGGATAVLEPLLIGAEIAEWAVHGRSRTPLDSTSSDPSPAGMSSTTRSARQRWWTRGRAAACGGAVCGSCRAARAAA